MGLDVNEKNSSRRESRTAWQPLPFWKEEAQQVERNRFAFNDHQDSVDCESEFSFAAHEVGHMFGLTDEYEDAKAG